MRLTSDEIAAGLNSYVGVQLVDMKESENTIPAVPIDQLLDMCSPEYPWEELKPKQEEHPLAILKGLFLDPKNNFYRTNPGVYEHHNPELRHALRRILLRWIIQEKTDDPFSEHQINQIKFLLTALQNEYENLPKEEIMWRITDLPTLSIKLVGISFFTAVLIHHIRDISSALSEGYATILLFLLFAALQVYEIYTRYHQIMALLPKEIKIELKESVGPFGEYQEMISRKLGERDIKLDDAALSYQP